MTTRAISWNTKVFAAPLFCALAALTGLAPSGCVYVDRQVTQGLTGPAAVRTISSDLPSDLQAVMRQCTRRLTLAAGQVDLQGRRDLLAACLDDDGQIDTSDLLADAPDAGTGLRRAVMANLLGQQL